MIERVIRLKTHLQHSFTTRINGKEVKLHVRYNSFLNQYYFNIDILTSGRYINRINSVMLTTGTDLFLQHPQLGIGQLFVIPIKQELYNTVPTPETIRDFLLYWVSEV